MSVSWVHWDVSAVGVHRILVTRDTTTSADGAFHFCRLPPGLTVLIRATAPLAATRAQRAGRSSVSTTLAASE